MALLLRLRRAAPLSSSLLGGRVLSAAVSSPSSPSLSTIPSLRPHYLSQLLSFRSSAPLSDRRNYDGEEKKFGPDDILFEGCDYNHWLITMDFPKDPAPTREEMIETYIQTLAKVVGSVEEAKKRMYALSTTTYHGFQAVMTEEMSENFNGLPGVVFILPDSYIDPVNKEYGGDKYENGVITPRPPPIQYGRVGRPRNQHRNDRPNYNQPPPRGNTSFGQQDFRQSDGRNYAPPQAQPGQDGRGYGPPAGRDYGQRDLRNYSQSGGRYPYQGERRDAVPPYQQDSNQGGRGPQDQRNFSQGLGGDNRFNGPSGYGGDRQSHNPGYTGEYRQDMGPGYCGEQRQGVNPGNHEEYKQGPGHGDNHRQESPPAPVDGPAGSWQGRS